MNRKVDLPSVDQVLRSLTNEVRTVLARRREALLAGESIDGISLEQEIEDRLRAIVEPSLRRVINATGVILHTNLGRAPLPKFQPILGYTNLEYDLDAGERGKRDVHTSGLLERLLGRPSVVVNNNAAAVYLVLNELASGHEVIVSRGELIEIGDGFRIPEIMARSGAILREVGTTNRTHLADYEQAINENTRLILRVHPSNFRVTGFTSRPSLEELAALGRAHNVPIYEDLGSGCMVDIGLDEPLVSSDANVVSFSGDKLLGGPQAGIITGDEALVRPIRRNPMYRAFRVDKLTIQVLETTLRHFVHGNLQAIPTLRMIQTPLEELRSRARRIVDCLSGMQAEIRESEAAIGGGSTPAQTLKSWAVELTVPSPSDFARRLRHAATPVVARIERDKIVLDMRTVAAEEENALVEALLSCQPATQSGPPQSPPRDRP
ncbi:MAG TPA: L-seryl-tRNA(Sec) selenium transferase [Bryobacteraceae bacterium]|nr:L-seryl-tRNA(Sec) selenium transferase [Bryobacteraceae bacterium]